MSNSQQQQQELNPKFEALLNYVKRARGFDFSGYKRTSLMRRIQKRMEMIGLESYDDYTAYLEVHPDEFQRLFDTILINVTNFFRDSNTWEFIASEIIPTILASKKPTDSIRIWSAGCASGEEAYTVAMLLAEAIGAEGFRERVKIYASDVDEDALNQARAASYAERELAGIPPPLLEKYFDHSEGRRTFSKELRRSVIFGRHDILQDAPISRIDLLICRNVLMYFNAEAQTRILNRFHFALRETGFLFLGKAEMLFTHGSLFTPIDLKRRVFTKVPRIHLRDRLALIGQPPLNEGGEQLSKHVRFREAAFDTSPTAQLVTDLNGFIALINERARMLLGLSHKDLSRPLADLELSLRVPELKIRLQEVHSERRPIMIKEIDWVTSSGDVRTLEVQISPLVESISGEILGTSITFNDVTRYKRLQEELEHSNQELETAYEELQSTNEELETTNEELQSTNEELETTNEELQSTIEELEMTNEELQSTNEELETINEEMQSTNEELHTINEELRRRTEELNQANHFLEAILTSLRGGVVVLDRDLHVLIWNHRAEDLWGVRPNEAQTKNFLNLDIGLPVEQLRPAIRATLSGEVDHQEQVVQATNRRGKAIQCKVTFTKLTGTVDGMRGVIMVMEEINV